MCLSQSKLISPGTKWWRKHVMILSPFFFLNQTHEYWSVKFVKYIHVVSNYDRSTLGWCLGAEQAALCYLLKLILSRTYAALDQAELHVMLTSDIACTMLVASSGSIDALLTADRNPIDVFVRLPLDWNVCHTKKMNDRCLWIVKIRSVTCGPRK